MVRRGSILTGLTVGASLMYLLDPGRGARRRAVARDRLTRGIRVTSQAAGSSGRDLAHRALGLTARLRRRVSRDAVDDVTLEQRVRSRIGRVVAHPHAIETAARDGVVTLRGAILDSEVASLLRAVRRVPGVRDVRNELRSHPEPANVPALQGGASAAGSGSSSSPGSRLDLLRGEWSPSARLVTGTAGAGLLAYGAARRGVPGAFLILAGVGLIARVR